jgi:hypothetical protein
MLCLLSLYVVLGLICPLFTVSHISFSPQNHNLYPYQPIPNASICTCLDSVPVAFFSKSNFASLSVGSKRHANFLFSLLIILAGDVSLNPGPPKSSHLKAFCTNIRSASSITDKLNKTRAYSEVYY